MTEETTQSVDTGEGQENPTVHSSGAVEAPAFSTAGNDQQQPPTPPEDNQPPRPDLLGEYNYENIISYGKKEPEPDPETFWERRRQPREGVNTAPQQPAFDLAPALQAWKPESGPQGFLQSVRESSPDSYAALANHVIDSHAEDIYAALVNEGILQDLPDEPAVSREWLIEDEIPAQFHEYALTLDTEMYGKIAEMEPHIRDQMLEAGMKLERLEQEQERQEQERQAEEERRIEQDAQKRFDGAMGKAVESTNNLVQEHVAGHYLHLEQSFSPFPDKQANRQLHQSILALAVAQVMQDEEARIMDHNIHAFLAHAAYEDLVSKPMDALRHRNLARDLAKRLNARVTPVRDAYVNLFRNNFAGVYQPPVQQPQPTAH